MKMRTKNMYCTLDTETLGGACCPTGEQLKTYDFGYLIHDRMGNIVASGSLLVLEHYNQIRDNAFYGKKNFRKYQMRILTGQTTSVATEREAIELLKNVCRMYNVKYVMAFNSAFDLEKTICKELLEEHEFIDTWLATLQTIATKKSYKDYCINNNFKSRSGNRCSTSVETVYGYLTNDPTFEEEHTALSDCLNELAIFLACEKMHKKYTRNEHCMNCKEKSFPKI